MCECTSAQGVHSKASRPSSGDVISSVKGAASSNTTVDSGTVYNMSCILFRSIFFCFSSAHFFFDREKMKKTYGQGMNGKFKGLRLTI